MILSNQVMATLSKFTLKAKKSLGSLKVADIINNKKYAFNLLVQGVMSDDIELISLTRKLSNELDLEISLIKAFETYVYILKVQGKSKDFIRRSKYFLIQLAQYVYGIKADDIFYRNAVNTFLANVNNDEKAFCINLAKNFYPYWKNTNSSIIEIDNQQSLEVEYKKKAFIHLWNAVDDEFLSELEDCQLRLYSNAMDNNYVLEKEIEVRIKMAKIILVELRKSNLTEEAYRATVNRIQSLISSVQMRDYFLVISREFYRFWTTSQMSAEVD